MNKTSKLVQLDKVKPRVEIHKISLKENACVCKLIVNAKT